MLGVLEAPSHRQIVSLALTQRRGMGSPQGDALRAQAQALEEQGQGGLAQALRDQALALDASLAPAPTTVAPGTASTPNPLAQALAGSAGGAQGAASSIASASGGILSFIPAIGDAVAHIAATVPGIANAFGAPGAKAQNQLALETLRTQERVATLQAASRADTIKAALPWVGGALGVGLALWGISKLASGRRRR